MRTNFPSNHTFLINKLRQINSHGACALIAKSDVHRDMLKKSRSDKTILTPAWASGLFCITRSVVNVNHDYNKAVSNQIVKNGFDPDNFIPEASKISVPVEGWPNTLLREKTDNPEQLYVRVFIEMGVKTSLEMYYFNDKGQNVTDKVTPEFRQDFLKASSGSEKQMLAGSGKEVKPREYKIENIIYLQKGDVVFNQLSQDLMELFGLEAISA
jgi:hypothetical protein